jgi:L-fucose isomerase-like protein
MAAKGKKGFQPGNKQGGRPRLPADIAAIKRLSKEETLLAICSVMRMTYRELENMREGAGATVAEMIAARMAIAAIDDGCYMSAQFLVNYAVGKPTTYEPLIDDQANTATMVFKTSVSQDGSIIKAMLDDEERAAIIEKIDNIDSDTSPAD